MERGEWDDDEEVEEEEESVSASDEEVGEEERPPAEAELTAGAVAALTDSFLVGGSSYEARERAPACWGAPAAG
jgi:hypothetical protein